MKYIIAGETFNSKAQVQERARNIAKKYSPGSSITGQDYYFMRELLNSHSEAPEKIGCGVVSIQVEIEPIYKTRAFFLTRADGTRTDFSYRNCAGVSPKDTPYKKFCDAARVAIGPIVLHHKIGFFHGRRVANCEVTGEPIEFTKAHVDHAPPYRFKDIVDGFIRERKIDIERIEYIESGDMNITTKFIDNSLERDFILYHDSKAILRVVSARWNTSADGKK